MASTVYNTNCKRELHRRWDRADRRLNATKCNRMQHFEAAMILIVESKKGAVRADMPSRERGGRLMDAEHVAVADRRTRAGRAIPLSCRYFYESYGGVTSKPLCREKNLSGADQAASSSASLFEVTDPQCLAQEPSEPTSRCGRDFASEIVSRQSVVGGI